jgi:hypothetical protein
MVLVPSFPSTDPLPKIIREDNANTDLPVNIKGMAEHSAIPFFIIINRSDIDPSEC